MIAMEGLAIAQAVHVGFVMDKVPLPIFIPPIYPQSSSPII
jgi:hypothetical protein